MIAELGSEHALFSCRRGNCGTAVVSGRTPHGQWAGAGMAPLPGTCASCDLYMLTENEVKMLPEKGKSRQMADGSPGSITLRGGL